MPIPIRLSLTLLTTALLATLNTPPGADPIAPLNECIQQRFQSFNVFGMSRVLPNRALGVNRFHPENPRELNVLTDLENKGYQVRLFLVGRYALDVPPPVGNSERFGLQGPALMTTGPKDSPAAADLLDEGKKALSEFAHRDGYDVRKGPWTLAMRPLRATSVSCVQCHTAGAATMIHDAAHTPKLGDALGVAMYLCRTIK